MSYYEDEPDLRMIFSIKCPMCGVKTEIGFTCWNCGYYVTGDETEGEPDKEPDND